MSAVLVGLGFRWLLGSLASMSWGDALGLAFIWALPCIVAGAIVGPMVARQASVRRAVGVGVLATAAAAFVQAWFAFAIGAGLARDLTGEPSHVLLDPALWLNALVLAVAMAPLGALAGWAVWRSGRHHAGTQTNQ